jgi:hypothetical protein
MGFHRITTGAAERAFLGLSDSAGAFAMNSDDPAGNYAGFQRSYTIGTDNWRCISKDNVTQQASDSGVSATSGANHRFETLEDSANSTWYFFIDSAQVCAHSTHVPTSGTRMSVATYITTFEAVSKSVSRAFEYAAYDSP